MTGQTYRELYEEGAAMLAAAGIPEARLDARLLLEDVCGTDTQTLLAHGERPVSDSECARYEGVTARRAAREPLAYIVGEQEFMGIPFYVTPEVLIPNQDTEVLVEEAMRELSGGMRILDLCTGSGCILLSLLRYSSGCSGVGTDLSEAALAVAERNAERMALSEQVEWRCGDLWDAVQPELFDIIVSNPPYIPTAVIGTLAPEVRSAEPYQALDGGEDGLVFYRRIIGEAARHLRIGGKLFLEIGYDQSRAVTELLREAGFLEIETRQDYGGLDRVVRAERGLKTK
ncbi:MAG: peptide chain release factor N(5)-glutamine methyltransferase [Eubacteriales bacterium]|nr:peptide chain release factor N(5)-glutamine methyltransferase [Eubacteriales bacterium]